MNYWFCYYQVYIGSHVNYHHVIIRANRAEIGNVVLEDFGYYLREVTRIHLSEKDAELKYYKSLIMDGESLLRKMRDKSNIAIHESIRL